MKKRGETGENENKKIIIMRAGVACAMALFFVAWIFGLKHQFKNADADSGGNVSFKQTKAALDKIVNDARMEIGLSAKILEQEAKNQKAREQELTEEQIKTLKETLLNRSESAFASSTIEAE